jgi:hypothetical protein
MQERDYFLMNGSMGLKPLLPKKRGIGEPER